MVTKHLGESTGPGPSTAFYESSSAFGLGRANVFWKGRKNAAGTTRVEVQQSALDGLGYHESLALLADLQGEGFRLSRLDEWVDDYEARITPERARTAVLGGQAVTHARPGRYVQNDDDGSSTYYLGAPSSDRLARVYDQRGPTRFELQSRRGSAQSAGASLVASGDPAAVLSNIVSFVDFRESRAYDHHKYARPPRLPWWAALVGDVPKAEGAPSRPRLSVEELALYAMQYWSRSLALLEREMQPGFMDQLLRVGRDRLAHDNDEEVAS